MHLLLLPSSFFLLPSFISSPPPQTTPQPFISGLPRNKNQNQKNMRREGGRQHAAHCIKSSPDPDLLPAIGFEPTPPVKPTNPWKQPGRCKGARCRSCHLHPITKSKGKAKGARKLRSCDVSLNHRLLSWRVVDGDGGGVRYYSGASASGIVGYLDGCHHDDDDDEEEEEEEDGEETEAMLEEGEDFGGDPIDETCDGVEGEEEEDDDDMGFYQVGIVWEYVDEEDWCVVGEM